MCFHNEQLLRDGCLIFEAGPLSRSVLGETSGGLTHAPLELHRRNVPDRRTPTPWIVEALDELEDLKRRRALRREAMLDEQFAVEDRIEALARCVVVAVANRTHRRTDVGAIATLAEGN